MSNLKVQLRDNNVFKMEVQNGARGLSAYETWINLGNEGTEQDFIDSLKADGGGNYNNIINKPRIGNVELVGNKNLEELGMTEISEKEIRNLF